MRISVVGAVASAVAVRLRRSIKRRPADALSRADRQHLLRIDARRADLQRNLALDDEIDVFNGLAFLEQNLAVLVLLDPCDVDQVFEVLLGHAVQKAHIAQHFQ